MTTADAELEAAFLGAVTESPHDPLPRLALADWLEERGRVALSAAWRRLAAPPSPAGTPLRLRRPHVYSGEDADGTPHFGWFAVGDWSGSLERLPPPVWAALDGWHKPWPHFKARYYRSREGAYRAAARAWALVEFKDGDADR